MYLGKVELRPLRVALFSGNYNTVMDGPARALNLLVRFLEKQGVEVRVYSPAVETPAFAPAGTLVAVPSFAIPGRPEYRFGMGLPRAIREDVLAFDPSLIHLTAPDFTGHGALSLAHELDIPAIASYHTRFDSYLNYYRLGALQPLITGIMTRFYNRCAQVLAPSPCMLKALREQGVSSDLRIFSRGVDHTLFNPGHRDQAWRKAHDVRDSEVLITFIGRMVMEKGLDVLARTLKTLRARCVPHHCLMVGDGPARAFMQKKMPGAIFTGHLSGEELARAYASSDIFFNPSQSETFGNTTLEAMASGVPAVCANAFGSRSLVAHGKTGFLADPLDKEDFANCLARLARSPALRATMAHQSVQRSRDYRWDAVLGSVLENYYTAVGQVSARIVPGQDFRLVADAHEAPAMERAL